VLNDEFSDGPLSGPAWHCEAWEHGKLSGDSLSAKRDATDLLNNTAAERERLEKLGTQLVAEVLKMKQLVVDEQDKLVEKTAEADARKALFDRLAKAVREKRYDDALKLIEENDKANAAPKTDRPTQKGIGPRSVEDKPQE
jgi:hypothetical protein